MGKKESIADTARVLGRMYDGIEYRGFSPEHRSQELVQLRWRARLERPHRSEFHPTQMLADMLTVQ